MSFGSLLRWRWEIERTGVQHKEPELFSSSVPTLWLTSNKFSPFPVPQFPYL